MYVPPKSKSLWYSASRLLLEEGEVQVWVSVYNKQVGTLFITEMDFIENESSSKK